jgi:hypothetical protein
VRVHGAARLRSPNQTGRTSDFRFREVVSTLWRAALGASCPDISGWQSHPEMPRGQLLPRESDRRPSRSNPADAATRSWVNSGWIRAFTSRSDDTQSSSVVSINAPDIHDLPIMVTHRFRDHQETQL